MDTVQPPKTLSSSASNSPKKWTHIISETDSLTIEAFYIGRRCRIVKNYEKDTLLQKLDCTFNGDVLVEIEADEGEDEIFERLDSWNLKEIKEEEDVRQ